MKFHAEKERLIQTVKTVTQVSVSTDPITRGILISANADRGELVFYGTDRIHHIQKRIQGVDIQNPNEVVATGSLLLEILKHLSGDTVRFESDEKHLLISCGTAKYDLLTRPVESFPRHVILFPEDTIKITGIRSLARRTVYAASNNPNQPVAMQGVVLNCSADRTQAVASDGARISIAELPQIADGSINTIILHKKALSALSAIVKPDEELYLGIRDGHVVLFNQEMVYATPLIPGTGVNSDQIIEKLNPVFFAKADAKQLNDALKLVCGYLRPGDDQCVNIGIRSDSISLSTKSELGHSQTSVQATDTKPCPESGFNYIPQHLMDYLARAAGPVSLRVDGQGLLLMEANQNKYVVTPRTAVKIKTTEKKKIKNAA